MAIDSDIVGVSQPGAADHETPTKEPTSTGPGDVLSLDTVDQALSAKMHLVNNVCFCQQHTKSTVCLLF